MSLDLIAEAIIFFVWKINSHQVFCIDVSLHNGGKLALTSGVRLNINMDSSVDVKNEHKNETEKKQTKVSCVNKLIEFWYDNVRNYWMIERIYMENTCILLTIYVLSIIKV